MPSAAPCVATLWGIAEMLNRIRNSLARWIAPRRTATRMYGGARSNRLTASLPGYSNSSADAELSLSLTQLRSRSRALVRDAGYAKRAKVIVINNVIGSGVGVQAQVASVRDNPRSALNSSIEAAWRAWSRAENCHVGGKLHFSDMERLVMGQIFEAGEVLVRVHSRRVGNSRIPMSLEVIEAERLADEYTTPGGAVPDNVRMGVEQDEYFRPIAYWIREAHPGDLRSNSAGSQRFVRVPADEILHLYLVDRWPQTRGEPWMHAAIRKLHDMDEYSAAELTAARMSANYFGTIKSDATNPLAGSSDDESGARRIDIEPGVIEQLMPGEELDFHSPNRPNSAIDAFMRHMLREVASAVGVSYESLSRDYSQSNYSGGRLALLDDRDLWRVLQQWWVRAFREPLHRLFMARAAASGAIAGLSAESYFVDPDRYCAVRWKLRGWTWVDPAKEVAAYKEAVKAGFTTVTKVIEQTGSGDDVEDVLAQRRAELDMLDDLDIPVDTTPVEAEVEASARPEPPEPDEEDDDEEEATNDPQARGVSLRR